MFLIYKIFINLSLVFSPLIIIIRLFKKKEHPTRFKEKFGFYTKKKWDLLLVFGKKRDGKNPVRKPSKKPSKSFGPKNPVRKKPSKSFFEILTGFLKHSKALQKSLTGFLKKTQ